MAEARNRGPLISAGTLLGVGMGGFVDGIVFHQLLQVHNMLSGKYQMTTLVNSEINMFWDGLFHAFCWVMVAIGLALLWRAGLRSDVPWSTRTLVGALVLGFGLFNLIEGILDHHVLRIHNVVQRLGESAWDYGFLGVGGVALIFVGWGMIRSGRNDTSPRARLPVAG
jgi:uncharacterized membrane protein